MKRSFKSLARGWHQLWPATVALVEMSGHSAAGDLPLKILCDANRWNKSYLRGLLFAGAPAETKLGRCPLRKLFCSPAFHKSAASLSLVSLSLGRFQHYAPPNYFFIPSWLRGEIKLPLPEKALRRESIKADLRKIRQQDFGFEIARGGAAFREFFHQMNRPYVRAVHGEAAFTDWLAEHRRWLVNYEILFVHRQREPAKRLAGIVIVYEKTGARLWTLGVRENGFEEVQNGVIAALYHFSFQHLHARGFGSVRTGSSRAFLNDGVLKFKKKLANEIIAPHPLGFALKILKLDTAARHFLLANPFTFQDASGLHAAVFTETPLTVELVQRWRKEFFHPGFRSLVIYTFCAEEKFTEAQLPPELTGQIEIRPAADLLLA